MKQHRKAADFFAIYGIAFMGRICALATPLGGYRVQTVLAIGDGENMNDIEHSFPWRLETLRQMISVRHGEELPERFLDAQCEKSRLS